ncbi:MAG: septum formation protein Maf [Bacteroidales bacterium]|nr:septum formation protein Maf [Bacteroidales bacterium]
MSKELEQLKKYRIILGSQSTRRQKLLEELGLKFKIFTKNNVIETFPEDMPITEVPLYLADLKSKAYESEVRGDTILITADTVVLCENEIVGKPKSLSDAKLMLKKLSGKNHTVVTGVSIRGLNKQRLFSTSTEVYFGELGDDEISYYVDNYKPVDKAGSYGIQEWLGYIAVEKIEGSYFNVMGLPVFELYKELKKFVKN